MLVQLANERLTILDTYDGSDEQFDRLIAVEAAIVASPRTDENDAIKRGILYETAEPDFQDLFIVRLFQSLR